MPNVTILTSALLCLLLLCLPAALHATQAASPLPSPFAGLPTLPLYDSAPDCSQWCFNGSVRLSSSIYGSTNNYCTDPRGCFWNWRMTIVPCSQALLEFDVDIGTYGTAYDVVDSAAANSLGFFCSQTGTGATIGVRAAGAQTPLMQWRYTGLTCGALLQDLSAAGPRFSGADVNVAIAGQQWFGSDDTPLAAEETECDTRAKQDLCTQCFAGVQAAQLSKNTSLALGQACGLAAHECQLHWSFCYDACRQRSSSISLRIGAGASLHDINPAAASSLTVVAGELPELGSSVIALADVRHIDDIAAGRASFYLAWQFRLAPISALYEARYRDALFVALHFGLSTLGGDELLVLNQDSRAVDSLGAFSWDGEQEAGIEAVIAAAKRLGTIESWLIAALVVSVVLGALGWAIALYLLWTTGRLEWILCGWRRCLCPDASGHHYSAVRADPYKSRMDELSYLWTDSTPQTLSLPTTSPANASPTPGTTGMAPPLLAYIADAYSRGRRAAAQDTLAAVQKPSGSSSTPSLSTPASSPQLTMPRPAPSTPADAANTRPPTPPAATSAPQPFVLVTDGELDD